MSMWQKCGFVCQKSFSSNSLILCASASSGGSIPIEVCLINIVYFMFKPFFIVHFVNLFETIWPRSDTVTFPNFYALSPNSKYCKKSTKQIKSKISRVCTHRLRTCCNIQSGTQVFTKLTIALKFVFCKERLVLVAGCWSLMLQSRMRGVLLVLVVGRVVAWELTLLHVNDIHVRMEETNKYSAACRSDQQVQRSLQVRPSSTAQPAGQKQFAMLTISRKIRFRETNYFDLHNGEIFAQNVLHYFNLVFIKHGAFFIF